MYRERRKHSQKLGQLRIPDLGQLRFRSLLDTVMLQTDAFKPFSDLLIDTAHGYTSQHSASVIRSKKGTLTV